MRTHADGNARPTDFRALLQVFTDELRSHNYSHGMIDRAERILPRLFTHLKKNRVRDIRAVTEEHLLDFTHLMRKTPTERGKPPSQSTMNCYVNVARRFFQHLTKRGVLLQDVSRAMPTRRIYELPKNVLSEKQAHKLMGAPNPDTAIGKRDRAILETLYGAGLRLNECARLDVADVDLGSRTVLVRNGKGKRDRVVPLAKRAAMAIAAYLAEARPEIVRDPREPALFLGFGCGVGRRLGKVMMSQVVIRYGRDVGVKILPHGLRHACATHLLRGGADVRHVQRLLGHRHIDSTARYTRVANNDLREAIERAHPREKPARGRRRRPAWS